MLRFRVEICDGERFEEVRIAQYIEEHELASSHSTRCCNTRISGLDCLEEHLVNRLEKRVDGGDFRSIRICRCWRRSK